MFGFVFKLQEHIRQFSRKLHLLFHRQKIFLVEESKFEDLFLGVSKNVIEVKCFYCNKILNNGNIAGCFKDEDGYMHFFCDGSECASSYQREA